MPIDKNELLQANDQLKKKIGELNRAEQINRVLFRISNAVNITKDLDELFGEIHRILGVVIDLSNFYIAIYNKKSKRMSFPYFVDQFDSGDAYADQLNEQNSLSGEVLISQKGVLYKKADLLLRKAGNKIIGTTPETWIGVPLKIKADVVGIMSTQCYEDEDRFDLIDLEILNSVSDQVALAIERKRNEQALVVSEKKYRSIIERIEDGYYEIDLEGNFTLVNKALGKMLGHSHQELLGVNITGYMSGYSTEQLRESFTAVLSTNEPGKMLELELICKEGQKRYVETIVSIVCNDDGEPTGFRGIARDISERKKVEEEKEKFETVSRQLQKTESLTRMAGGIAHHFNNLIGVVMGNLEMVMDDLSGKEEKSETARILTLAIQASRKAVGISSLMLTYLGQTTGKHVPLDLSAVCRKSLTLLQREAPEDIVFVVDLASPGPIIDADLSQIQQVLMNLVINAWEASSSDKRKIYLTVKPISSADISGKNVFPFDWRPEEATYACLEVKDEGFGVVVGDIEKLFEPFFSSKFAGRGLGLSVVQGIAKSHNGVVTVHSKVGKGSIFRVFFPLSDLAVEPTVAKAGQSFFTEGRDTVLLIDDEQVMRNKEKAILTRLGFKVLLAENGRAAVEVFREHVNEISIVLCDLNMPDMGGRETLLILREMELAVPVVFTSRHSESKEMAAERSMFPQQVFLHKPYQKVELINALVRAMAVTR
ncbi:MAG: hypothetical protein COA36_03155 [Desulfotalea sp.]|nr:MAG: hypothetical protein COA36_03155 [Desulfotalea sp.]